MEEFITLIKDISLPGSIALSVWLVLKSPITNVAADWLRKLALKDVTHTNSNGEHITLSTIDERVKTLASNHMHELHDSLGRIEELLRENNRMTQSVQSTLEFIKGRINGKSY